jgi:broad specificity phosphatase PhoE
VVVARAWPSLLFATALAAALPIAPPVRAEGPPDVPGEPKPAALLKALKTGGHVIYIRHGQTEKDFADQIAAVMGDCSTQRMLSERGWQQARSIGRAFVRLGLPVGEVVSSEYCRAWQTADLAFGRYKKNPALNFEPAEDYTAEQEAAMRDRIRPLLAKAPKPGTNDVLVGHDDPFEAATGIYPEPQGVAYIVKPNGKGGFEVIANLGAEEWARLGP